MTKESFSRVSAPEELAENTTEWEDDTELQAEINQEQEESDEYLAGQAYHELLEDALARTIQTGELQYQRTSRGAELKRQAGLSDEEMAAFLESDDPSERQKAFDYLSLRCFDQDGRLYVIESNNYRREEPEFMRAASQVALFEGCGVTIGEAMDSYRSAYDGAPAGEARFLISKAMHDLAPQEYEVLVAAQKEEAQEGGIKGETAATLEGLMMARLDGSVAGTGDFTETDARFLLALNDSNSDELKYPDDVMAAIHEKVSQGGYYDIMANRFDQYSQDMLAAASSELSQEDGARLINAAFYVYKRGLEAQQEAQKKGENAPLPEDLAKVMVMSCAHEPKRLTGNLAVFDTPELRAAFEASVESGELKDSAAVVFARAFLKKDLGSEGGDSEWARSEMMRLQDYGGVLANMDQMPKETVEEAIRGLQSAIESDDMPPEIKARVLHDASEFYKKQFFAKNQSEQVQAAMACAKQAVIEVGDYRFMTTYPAEFGDQAVRGLLDQVKSLDKDASDEDRKRISDILAQALPHLGKFSDETIDEIISTQLSLGDAGSIAKTAAAYTRPSTIDALMAQRAKLSEGDSPLSLEDIEAVALVVYKNKKKSPELSAACDDKIRAMAISDGMLSIIGSTGIMEFSVEEATAAFDAFEARWQNLSDEEKAKQKSALRSFFHRVSGGLMTDEQSKLLGRTAQLISELHDYDTIAGSPEHFSEADIAGLVEATKSEDEKESAHARELLAKLYTRLNPTIDVSNPNFNPFAAFNTGAAIGKYSSETLELARQAVIESNDYAYMLKHYANFPEVIAEIEDKTLSKEALRAIADIKDDSEVLQMLSDTQRLAADLIRGADGSRSNLLSILSEKIKTADGTEKSYYEILLENGSETKEIIESMFSSASGDLRRFTPAIVEQAIVAERGDQEGLTTAEKYLRDERDFFMSPIPHYLKLAKSAIYYDISSNGIMQKQGTSVLRGIENYEQARTIIGGDMLRSAMRSNSMSLRSFLERAVKGELSDEEQPYLEQVLSDASNTSESPVSTPLELLQQMTQFVRERDAANRGALVEIEGRPGHYRLAQRITGSDLKKSIKQQYLDMLFEDGHNAPEMLGANAGTDVTAYDSDMAISRNNILDREASGEAVPLDEVLRDSLSEGYGTTKVIMRLDSRFYGTKSSEPGAEYVPTKYEVYDREGMDSFRGIRTGFGSLDVDAFAVRSSDSTDIPRLKFEIAKRGCYIPIIDRKTEEVVFTPSEFDALRAKFAGLSRYGIASYEGGSFETDLDTYQFGSHLEIPTSITDNIGAQSYTELMSGFDAKKQETVAAQNAIVENLMRVVETGDFPEEFKQRFAMMGSSLNEQYSPNASLFSTGSTGRLANVPHDGDYDFMLLLDQQDYSALGEQLTATLNDSYGGRKNSRGFHTGILGGKLQFGGRDLDLDITIMPKTDQIATSTDSTLAERYRVMEAQDPEAYKQVIANVIIAKALFKNAGCYKKRGSTGAVEGQGGIGGIGVENWILQNGGSLYEAMRSFVAVSDEAIQETGRESDAFTMFKIKYPIFDMGQNFESKGYRSSDYPHDNLTEGDKTKDQRFEIGGWQKMLEVCRETLAKYEQE